MWMVSSWWCQDIMIFIPPWSHPDITMARFPWLMSRIMPSRWGIIKVSMLEAESMGAYFGKPALWRCYWQWKSMNFFKIKIAMIPGIKRKKVLKNVCKAFWKTECPCLLMFHCFGMRWEFLSFASVPPKNSKKLVTCSYDLQTLLSTRP